MAVGQGQVAEVSLALVFWLVFAATILMAARGWIRSQAKTTIVLALMAMAAVGLIA